MITLAHGTDTALSRNFLHEIKQKNPDYKTIDGTKLTLSDLDLLLGSQDLFVDDTTIIIENFFKRRSDLHTKQILALLTASKKEVILWEEDEVPKQKLSNLQKARIMTFNIPKSLFTFLDELKPNNTNRVLSLFHTTLQITEQEIILFMLIRHFRMLLALSSKNSEIDETARLAPWQRQKLEKQASLFSEKELIRIYKKLFELDLASKTGKTPLKLTPSIDFFLLEI